MKLRSTLLLLAASAVAGAIGLSASQAEAALPWCTYVSYTFNESMYQWCTGDGQIVTGRAQAVTVDDPNQNLVSAKLEAGNQVSGRYPIAMTTALDAYGNAIWGCSATDYWPADGSSAYDNTGCQAGSRFRFQLGY